MTAGEPHEAAPDVDALRARVDAALARLRNRSSHDEIQRVLAEMDESMAATEALIAERYRQMGQPLPDSLRRRIEDRATSFWDMATRLDQIATYARRQATHHEAEGLAGLARPWWHVAALATDREGGHD